MPFPHGLDIVVPYVVRGGTVQEDPVDGTLWLIHNSPLSLLPAFLGYPTKISGNAVWLPKGSLLYHTVP